MKSKFVPDWTVSCSLTPLPPIESPPLNYASILSNHAIVNYRPGVSPVSHHPTAQINLDVKSFRRDGDKMWGDRTNEYF